MRYEFKNILTAILILLVGALQISCSLSAGAAEEKKELKTIDATLLIERSGAIEGEWHSDEIVPYFGIIPGSLFGSPLEDVILPAEVDDELRFVVELSDWAAIVEAAAAPLSEPNFDLGLRIQPTDTRLLRISTFAYDLKHDAGMNGAFEETDGVGRVVLFYTDRPCVISGAVSLDGDEYTFNISLPTKGFHYIVADEENHLSRWSDQKELLFITDH